MPGHDIEISVSMQDRHIIKDRMIGNQAVIAFSYYEINPY
jgi:hypothetical protein